MYFKSKTAALLILSTPFCIAEEKQGAEKEKSVNNYITIKRISEESVEGKGDKYTQAPRYNFSDGAITLHPSLTIEKTEEQKKKDAELREVMLRHFPTIEKGGKVVLVSPDEYIKHHLRDVKTKYALISVPDG